MTLQFDSKQFVLGEEASLNLGNTVSPFDERVANGLNMASRLIDDDFHFGGYTEFSDTNGSGAKELSNHLTGNHIVHTVFFLNIPYNDW